MLLTTAVRQFVLVSFALTFARCLPGAELCVKTTDLMLLPLPQASIVVVNLQNQRTEFKKADARGNACFKPLAEGIYSAEVSLEGFLTAKYYSIKVNASDIRKITAVLPFGEITEGGLLSEAVVSGTLKEGDSPVANARICFSRDEVAKALRCVDTDELGEYAVVLPPATYRYEVTYGSTKRSGQIDASIPGKYRNQLSTK